MLKYFSFLFCKKSFIPKKYDLGCCQYQNQEALFTGKSLSEELIFASTNPQYDNRLFIVHEDCKLRITAEHVVYTNLTFRTILVQNIFCRCCELLKKIYLYWPSFQQWFWIEGYQNLDEHSPHQQKKQNFKNPVWYIFPMVFQIIGKKIIFYSDKKKEMLLHK